MPKKNEKPAVKIFLSDIFQELPPSPSDVRAECSTWESNWRSDWRLDHHNNWYNNTRTMRHGVSCTIVGELMLRKEVFGGIAYSPMTRKIYSFNDSGFDIINRLQAGTEKEDVEKGLIATEDLESFIIELAQLGIHLK